MERSLTRLLLMCFVVAAIVAGCGDDDSGGGPVELQFWSYNEPSGAFDKAVAFCNEQADGAYEIAYQKLGANADLQRQQLVRRLAAEDSSIDLMAMDVIWTAEFAEAEWIKPFPDDVRQQVSRGTLEGALETATYQGALYGAPANSNTQLLWYRKDEVQGEPPRTWDELIDAGEELDTNVEVQAAAYEGYVVWFTSLIQSAGGQILEDADTVAMAERPTRAALEVISRLANSEVASPSIENSREDSSRQAFEDGDALFQVNYPFIYPSAAAIDGFQEKIGWAPYPRVNADTPAKAPIGGFNFGVGNFTSHPDEAFDAVACLRNERNQRIAAVDGGLPPTLEALYDNEDFQQDYPFADLIRKSIDTGAVRPKTPLYADLSLAIASALSPPEGVASSGVDVIRQAAQDALDGEGLN